MTVVGSVLLIFTDHLTHQETIVIYSPYNTLITFSTYPICVPSTAPTEVTTLPFVTIDDEIGFDETDIEHAIRIAAARDLGFEVLLCDGWTDGWDDGPRLMTLAGRPVKHGSVRHLDAVRILGSLPFGLEPAAPRTHQVIAHLSDPVISAELGRDVIYGLFFGPDSTDDYGRSPRQIAEKHGPNVFVKSIEKDFSQITHIDDLFAVLDANRDHRGNLPVISVQECVTFEFETRFFVVDDTVVTWAPRKVDDVPSLDLERRRPSDLGVREFSTNENPGVLVVNPEFDEMHALAHDIARTADLGSYVLDLGLVDGVPRVVELNPLSNAGLYGCDVRSLMRAMLASPDAMASVRDISQLLTTRLMRA